MSMLATTAELAGWMQQDLDTYTATQALTLASSRFETEADTKFASTSATYTVEGAGVVRKPDGSLLAATCWLQDPERQGTDNRFVSFSTIAGVDRMLLRD